MLYIVRNLRTRSTHLITYWVNIRWLLNPTLTFFKKWSEVFREFAHPAFLTMYIEVLHYVCRSPYMNSLLYNGNLFFTAVFAFESFVKLFAMGPRYFFAVSCFVGLIFRFSKISLSLDGHVPYHIINPTSRTLSNASRSVGGGGLHFLKL